MQTARTTIELEKELLKKAKQKAIEEEKTLKQVLNELVRKSLEPQNRVQKNKPKFKIRTFDMGAVKLPLTREEIYEGI